MNQYYIAQWRKYYIITEEKVLQRKLSQNDKLGKKILKPKLKIVGIDQNNSNSLDINEINFDNIKEKGQVLHVYQ